MKFSFDIKNDKECCHFIISPSKIGHKEFKNDCSETSGPTTQKLEKYKKFQGHNFGIMIFLGEFDQRESVNHYSRS